MKAPQAPHLDERRTEEFFAELGDRAQAWIPTWGLADGEHDFGRALLHIAARFSSEVAERLDGAGDKMRRGLLDWLGVPRKAARPARVPVVFKMADSAIEAVVAPAPVQIQADADGTPVVFETEQNIRIVPGRLQVVVGVDAAEDAFYFPPPGLVDLQPLIPQPIQWQLKSFAAAGATKLQLDPETGLAVDMIIAAGGAQYRITQPEPDNGIVTIDPSLDSELPESTVITKVTNFAPFDGIARNRQEHALYLGHMELLNIEAAATIDVVGASSLITGIKWQYWGKAKGSDQIDWQSLNIAPPVDQKAEALVLIKPEGAVEPKKIGEINSRWIRASVTKVEGEAPLLRVDELKIQINCKKDFPACPKASDQDEPSPAAEAIANTTPLVLDNVFYPLGKEPRQFDAFYLGSQEAFSKKGAKVQLCFEMADRTFSALAAVREGTFANRVLAGVAKDRSLHLLSFDPATGVIGKFRDRDPLQPPQPGYLGAAEAGNAVALDARPPWRLPVWSEPDPFPFNGLAGFLVGTSAGDTIWLWREHTILPQFSGWINFGKLPTNDPPTNAAVDGLVYLAGATPTLAALRGDELFIREWPNGPQWNSVVTLEGSNLIRLKSIVAVLVEDSFGRLVTSRDEGMLGIDINNKLFRVAKDGVCTPLLATFDFDTRIRPIAIEIGGKLTVAAVTYSDPPELVAYDTTNTKQVSLGNDTKVVAALEAVLSGGKFHVLATVRDSSSKRLITWAPFETSPADYTFKSPMLGGGLLEGAPIAVARFVVIPGARADILVNEFNPSLRLLKSADIEIGVVVPDSVPPLAIDDLIVRLDSGIPVSRKITRDGFTKDGEVFYPIASGFPSGTTGFDLDAYQLSRILNGTFNDPDLTLDSADQETVARDWLWISGEFYQVNSITTNNNQRIATLVTPNSNGSVPPNGQYVRPINTGGSVAPFMQLDPTTAGGSGDWNVSLLTRILLIFPDQTPEEQRAKAFSVTVDNKPEVVVLSQEFQSPLTNPVDFLVDGAFGEWRRDAGDTSTNPELSWEYWNGKGWWKLDDPRDDTQNLKTTGALRFTVPSDIVSSDWAGKTNFWIRARLIGGDYGREKVTAKTKTVGDTTEQTIERSTEGIRAPSVLKLEISYRVCDPVLPTVVLTKDSGSLIDQSDANRTGGAIVEAFVPLSLMLARLSNTKSSAEPAPDCPPQYDCQKTQTPMVTVSSGSTSTPTTAKPPVSQRSLFIGLAAKPSEAPVNILLLIEERDHTAFAPMTIEALVADHFEPIVSNDATRALGESGLLSMAFAVPPTPSDLFGQKGLTWLRLTPKANVNGAWIPALRGAYLNAVWASATETLTREMLGSSDGAPNMVVRLARPPVLDGTLELRVKEPLDEEERARLRKVDARIVLCEVEGLPGDWVLWKQVPDPNDEPAGARVYALDESNGEIRFGDGQHGLIPPIGRDSIVAFSYKRTEPGPTGNTGVPGNLITARMALNLVSPVATVESVTAADQAAGGAPPENDERVLYFGYSRLRHRNRAVTLQDLEDLTRESSPDIAQARAIARQGYVCLVVVMSGKNPMPNAAQRRELRNYLLAVAPTSLGATNALRIAGPGIRRLRLELTLRVTSLDKAGALGTWVKEKLERFFDTSTGGIDEVGWQLGANPSEDDIAFAFLDAPDLESLKDVTLYEIAADDREQPWPALLKPTELAMLDKDPLRIHFETDEVMM